MTLTEISTYCCQTVGDTSPETLDYCKRAIRLKYQTLYDAHLWRESLRMIDAVPLDPTLNGVIFLPFDTEEVIFLSFSYDGISYTRLTYRERDWIERVGGGLRAATLPGNTPWFYRAENLAWPSFNPGQLTFTSYDKGIFTLYIAGSDTNGYPVDETFKMQAITNADGSVNPAIITTVNSYQRITMISKGQTQNPLLCVAQFPPASTTNTVSIPPGISELVFTQIVLVPPPLMLNDDGSPRSLFIRSQLKLKADALNSDYSVPRISHIMDGLIEFTLSSLYKKARQLGKADSCEQKAIAHIQAAVNVEKNQSEFRQQVVPTIYERGDYLGHGMGRVSSAYPFG